MINTLDDVVSNNFVNRFKDIAKSYGLEGAYIKYHTSTSPQEDVYFVCGIDKETIRPKGLNVESILAEKQKQYLNYNPHIAAFKITGNDPLLTHQEVVEYCKNAEFLIKLYQEHNMPLPQMMPKGILEGLKMAHYNATNPALPQVTRHAYERDINETLRKQDTIFTNHGSDSKKATYYLYKQYDTQKSKFANWLKRMFGRDKNKVSINHLILTCKETTTIGVHISDAQKVQEELRKHPEIIYWMADKPVGQKLKCPDDQGFGSQKANDRRFIAFAFDSERCSDVMAIVNRIEHPDGYKTSYEELLSKYEHRHHLAIPADDYDKYTRAMAGKGVKYCIKDTTSRADIIHLVIASNVQKNIDDILNNIKTDHESEHLYTNLTEREATARDEALKEEKGKMEIAMLKKAGEFLGSSNVEVLHSYGDMQSNVPADSSDDLLI